MEDFKIGERVKVKLASGFFEGTIEQITERKIIVKFDDLEMRIYAQKKDVRKLNINKFTE